VTQVVGLNHDQSTGFQDFGNLAEDLLQLLEI
jgi:hypothetical protein